MFDPQSRSSSHRVLQNSGSDRNQGLPGVVGRHFQPSTAKAKSNTLQDPFLKDHLFFDDSSHNLLGNVILGRTQPPCRNDEFGPLDGLSQHLFETVFAISNDGFYLHLDANGVELFGKVEGVCICTIGRQ